MRRSTLVSAIVLALASASMSAVAAVPAAKHAVEQQATTQLPRNVRPVHYDVAVTRLHRLYDEIMTAQGPASSEKSDSPLMY